MAAIGFIKGSKPYLAKYESHITTLGTSIMSVVWVPKSSIVPAPESQHRYIAPGTEGKVSGTAPSCDDFQFMLIDIDVPDGAASGVLTVESDGKPILVFPTKKDILNWKFTVN